MSVKWNEYSCGHMGKLKKTKNYAWAEEVVNKEISASQSRWKLKCNFGG